MIDQRFEIKLNSDLVTSARKPTSRIKADIQQTSFEENRQFRFYEDMSILNSGDGVPFGEQLVYKITQQNPVNVFERTINIWQGGRKYSIYPDDGNATFTGALTDISSTHIFNINGNLSDSGLAAHPQSSVVIERDIGAGIFSYNGVPVNGTASLTDGNSNRATAAYTANGSRSGIAAGQSFWIVFDHIGANNNTLGIYLLAYEELFS